MTDYPEDVMKAAREAYLTVPTTPTDAWFVKSVREGDYDHQMPIKACARAILAERERCAKIADEWMPIEKLLPLCGADMNEAAVTGQVEAGERIAAAIRGGSNA